MGSFIIRTFRVAIILDFLRGLLSCRWPRLGGGGGGGGGGEGSNIKKVGMLVENFEIDP